MRAYRYFRYTFNFMCIGFEPNEQELKELKLIGYNNSYHVYHDDNAAIEDSVIVSYCDGIKVLHSHNTKCGFSDFCDLPVRNIEELQNLIKKLICLKLVLNLFDIKNS